MIEGQTVIPSDPLSLTDAPKKERLMREILTKRTHFMRIAPGLLVFSLLVVLFAASNGSVRAASGVIFHDPALNARPLLTGAVITWTSQDAEDGFVEYSLNNTNFDLTEVDSRGAFAGRANQFTHAVSIAGASLGDIINYRINQAGTVSADYSVTLPAAQPNPIPAGGFIGTFQLPGAVAAAECVVTMVVTNHQGTTGKPITLLTDATGGFSQVFTEFLDFSLEPFASQFLNVIPNFPTTILDMTARCDGDFTYSDSIGTLAFFQSPNVIFGNLQVTAPAKVSVSDVTVTEAGTAIVTVALDKAHTADVTVNISTNGDTATAGVDYTEIDTTATITAGLTEVTVDVVTLTDSLNEADETLTVSIINGGGLNGASIDGSAASATITITDDDAQELSIQATANGDEGTTVNLTVTATNPSDEAVTFDFDTTAGSATDTDDYTGQTTQQYTLDALATTVVIPVVLGDDILDELPETFTGAISNASGRATIAANPDDTATVTINDTDVPTITIETTSTVGEGAGSATLTVSADIIPAEDITFNALASDGTATSADYGAVSAATLITLSAGSDTVDVDVAITDDSTNEADEAFTVAISGVSPTGQLGVADTATVTITDNDAQELTIETTGTGDEGTTVNLTVTATNASDVDVTFEFTTADGSATGVDYVAQAGEPYTLDAGATSVDVQVVISIDLLDENDEDFTGAISQASGRATIGGADTATVTITDTNVPVISISPTTASVNEDAGDTTGVGVMAVADIAPVADVTVDFSTADVSATAGADYTATTDTLTIPGGQSQSGEVIVPILEDLLGEGPEDFTVQLSNLGGAEATLGVADTATITIVDNDAPVLSIDDVQVNEGGTATLTVTISQVQVNEPVTFDYLSVDGTAVQPGDYIVVSGSGSIAAGELTTTITVNAVDDAIDEITEDYFVQLSNPGGGDNLAPDPLAPIVDADAENTGGQVEILDGDEPPVLSIDDVTVNEDDGTATFAVSLSTASGLEVTVDVDSNSGTATDGTDYVNVSETVTFTAGSTSETVTVTITNDTDFEGDENYTLDLSGETNATIGDPQGDGLILNDDAPTAVDDSYNATEDTLLDVTAGNGVMENDSLGGADQEVVIVSPPAGTLNMNSDGTFTYTGGQDFVGDDTFIYQTVATQAGGTLDSNEVIVTITVANENDAPVANNFNHPVELETPTDVNVILNVDDPDKLNPTPDTFTIALVSGEPESFTPLPPIGDLVGAQTQSSLSQPDPITGLITYDPGSFVGTQTFVYTVTDEGGNGITSNTAIVTLSQGPTWEIEPVGDVEIDEDGNATVEFTVTLINAKPEPSRVGVRTLEGGDSDGIVERAATANVDYGAINRSGANALQAISLSRASENDPDPTTTVTVTIFNDNIREGIENFTIELFENQPTETSGDVTIVEGSLISITASAIEVLIDDQQDTPVLTVLDTTVVEATDLVTNLGPGGTYATVTIVLTGRTLLEATVDWATLEIGSAIDLGNVPVGRVGDFGGDGGPVVFEAPALGVPPLAVQTREVMIHINDDEVDEHNETFEVMLSNAVEATIAGLTLSDHNGTVTIIDNDDAPSLKVWNTVVNEGVVGGTVDIAVVLTGANTEGVSVDVSTGLGTATADVDYDAIVGTLTWGADESGPQFLTVTIIDDGDEEDAETTGILIQEATLDTLSGNAAPTVGVPATVADGSGVLTIEDNEPVVAVIGITSLGELLPGDWFFVVASDGDDVDGEGGTFSMSLLDINGSLEPLSVGDDGLSFLALAHDFDRIRSKITDGVYLGRVSDWQLEGLSEVQATVDGSSSDTTVNLLDARTNRNFFLWPSRDGGELGPGLNYTGLALVPDADNDDFSEILAQGVRTSDAFHDRIMEVSGDRATTLADVVQTIYTYQSGVWRMYNTADPITGTAAGGTVTNVEPFQGMIIKTRDVVVDSEGEDINVFDQAQVRGFTYDAPVRMNIRGGFLSASNSPLSPPSKVLSFGFNLLAPHISGDTPFDTVFRGSGGDFRAIFGGAISVQRQATPIEGEGIDVKFEIGPITKSQSSDTGEFSAGVLRPELAYWVRVSSGSPTVTPSGPAEDTIWD